MLWGAAEIALAQEALGAPAGAGAGRPGRGGALGQGLPRAGPQAGRGHPQPLRHRRARGGRAAPGDAQSPAHPVIPPGDAAGRHGRPAQGRRATGPAASRSALGTGPRLQRRHAARVRLYITNALYQRYGGSGDDRAFADQQLGFALGANPWGTSFVVGAGDMFPQCMQSEIANLAGCSTAGATSSSARSWTARAAWANFAGLGTVTGMKALQRRQLPAVRHQDRRLRGQRGQLARRSSPPSITRPTHCSRSRWPPATASYTEGSPSVRRPATRRARRRATASHTEGSQPATASHTEGSQPATASHVRGWVGKGGDRAWLTLRR